MAGVTADVEVVWTLDVPDLQKRLDGAVLRVLTKGAKAFIADARKNWRGWIYKGRPTDKRNISINAWASTVQGTEHPYSLTIANEARGVYTDAPYVAYIHRAGTSDKAADVLFGAWAGTLVPQLEAALTVAIRDELGKPGPVKRRRLNRASDATRLILT
jgi:hypothetical protein